MDKKVFVTGAAGGLGLCIAKRHAALGDMVFAIDIKETPDLVDFLRENPAVRFFKCDIADAGSVGSALRPIAEQAAYLDYIYNCAAIYRFEDRTYIEETDFGDAARMYEINALGGLYVVQALWPSIGEGTAILFITSEAGSIGQCWRSKEYAYCMSKAAANMGAVILQNHFNEINQNTRVMCIHPGWMRTQMGGPDALKSPDRSVSPEKSAEDIVGIALDIDALPPGQMYVDHERKPYAW